MRRALASTAFLAAAASVGQANASCTYNSVATPSGVFALSGDVCTAAAGAYAPTVQPDVSLPVTYTGFGFFAYSGGIINSANAVTINTTGANNAYGAWSDGTGARINLDGGTAVSTTGAASFGLYASQGGVISVTTPVTITTTGSRSNAVDAETGGGVTLNGGSVNVSGFQSFDLIANGSSSQIQATGVSATSSVSNWTAVQADQGASLTYTGGSILTTGSSALNVLSNRGSSLSLSGVTLEAAGNGSGALNVANGSSLTADGLTVTVNGTTDSANGHNSFLAINGSSTLTINNSTMSTTGAYNFGISTSNTGVTTLTNELDLGIGCECSGRRWGVRRSDDDQRRVDYDHGSRRFRN